MADKLSTQEKIDAFMSYATDVVQLPIHQITHRCDPGFGPITQKQIESLEEAHLTQLLVFIRPLALLKSEPLYLDKIANAISQVNPSVAPECRAVKQRLASLALQARQQSRIITDENANTLWAGSEHDLIDVYLYGRLLHVNTQNVRDWQHFEPSVREYAVGHAHSYVIDHAIVICETLQIIRKALQPLLMNLDY